VTSTNVLGVFQWWRSHIRCAATHGVCVNGASVGATAAASMEHDPSLGAASLHRLSVVQTTPVRRRVRLICSISRLVVSHTVVSPSCRRHRSAVSARLGISGPTQHWRSHTHTHTRARAFNDTIRYDTIRDAILTCARKPT